MLNWRYNFCLATLILMVVGAKDVFPTSAFVAVRVAIQNDQSAAKPEAVLNASQQAQEVTPLQPDQPIKRELAGGHSHAYQVALSANQFLHVVIEQQELNVATELYGPDGKQIIEVNSLNDLLGEEHIFLIARAPGSYRLDVKTVMQGAKSGRYEIKVAELRDPTPRDAMLVAGQLSFAEGQQLRRQANAQSLPQALGKYQQALEHWRAASERPQEAETLLLIGLVHSQLGEKRKALGYYQQSLQLRRALGDRYGEAKALNNLGLVHLDLGEHQPALDYLIQSLPLRRAVGDRLGEAVTLLNIGGVNNELGEKQRALDYYQQSLLLRRALGDRLGEAGILHNIAAVYDGLGDKQRALDYYHQALPIRREVQDRRGEAATLNGIGSVHNTLGDKHRAADYFNQALALYRATGDRRSESNTLINLGTLFGPVSQTQQARDYFNQALALSRVTENRRDEARALLGLGSIHEALGEKQQALDCYQQALPLFRALGNRRLEANALTLVGRVYTTIGEYQKAFDHFQRALPLSRAAGDPIAEANTRYYFAAIERARGNLSEARTQIESARKLIESLRARVTRQDLRASYFAAVQDYFELNIALLMQLHEQQPAAGHDAAALQVSEQARARGLLELLTEANANIRQGISPELATRERDLQQRLSGKAARLLTLRSSQQTEPQATTVEKEIDALTTDLQQVQAQIRQDSPRYAALTQPQPLSLIEIQQQVLDADTLLLEYSLGKDRSFLWAVTANSISAFKLPKREEIEAQARRVYELLTARARSEKNETPEHKQARIARSDLALPEASAKLSQVLLGSVAAQLRKRRLLIVADGALQYVPFAMLPQPESERDRAREGRKSQQSAIRQTQSLTPLIVNHEVVSLPSASTLAVLRRELTGRAAAPKTLIVMADPVFSKDDARFATLTQPVKDRRPNNDQSRDSQAADNRSSDEVLLRSAAETGTIAVGQAFARLQNSRREAEAIAAIAPAASTHKALDFEASRELALSEKLSEYRIVHFATHGLANSAHSELSGLVLSLVDERGEERNGFLRLHEIYNLKLPADLVVLSACQTALGQEIRGEGLIGLTRGFMYAGAQCVAASLWQVDDRATAELMKRFYAAMLGARQLPPSAALRAAQLEVWKDRRWRAPFYWAGFALQGEWR